MLLPPYRSSDRKTDEELRPAFLKLNFAFLKLNFTILKLNFTIPELSFAFLRIIVC